MYQGAIAISFTQQDIEDIDYLTLPEPSEDQFKEYAVAAFSKGVAEYTAREHTKDLLKYQLELFLLSSCPWYCPRCWRPVCAWYPRRGWKTFGNACQFNAHNRCRWPQVLSGLMFRGPELKLPDVSIPSPGVIFSDAVEGTLETVTCTELSVYRFQFKRLGDLRSSMSPFITLPARPYVFSENKIASDD